MGLGWRREGERGTIRKKREEKERWGRTRGNESRRTLKRGQGSRKRESKERKEKSQHTRRWRRQRCKMSG
ncbi:hypothetical protein BCV70DRAFT_110481 [Testicularia cyperi]|uniref:Uncharacterized protein n=1 Tax=Testicularia cyperi TaxID=1882483 RepID=A0A317XP91_9BASI|nr:hypothetical protein BCV70DRAFT_110481 [Testicularia cyperi]